MKKPGPVANTCEFAFGRQKQEDCHNLRFLVYMEFSSTAQQRPHIKQRNKKLENFKMFSILLFCV